MPMIVASSSLSLSLAAAVKVVVVLRTCDQYICIDAAPLAVLAQAEPSPPVSRLTAVFPIVALIALQLVHLILSDLIFSDL